MLIALLAIIGVDLAVIVVLVIGVLSRRRWVSRRPGAFAGAIRVASGEHDGLPSKWRRGYGRWVSEVFVWTKKPFLFRNELLAVDGVQDARSAREGEVKRLGDEPVVVELVADDAVIHLAAHGKHRDCVLGPYRDRAVTAEHSWPALSDPAPRAPLPAHEKRPTAAPTSP